MQLKEAEDEARALVEATRKRTLTLPIGEGAEGDKEETKRQQEDEEAPASRASGPSSS